MGKSNRTNVLLLSIHDLTTQLGCYGNPVVRSPNIDRLAGRGRLFGRHVCQYPLCGPSRASFLTGRRPDTTGVLDNLAWFRDALPDVVTLPAHFKAHGYWTAKRGTVFHGGLDDEPAWDVGGQFAGPRPNRTPEQQQEREARADRFEPSEDGEEGGDARTADWAVETLEAYRGENPFFLAAGFSKPHVPLVASKRYFEMYDGADIPLPPRSPEGEELLPEPALRPNFDIFIRRYAADDDEARRAILAYYACTTFLDEQVGKILDTVERLGLWENTVVVLMADHGFHLGEYGLWSKMTLFDASTRVPFVVAAPEIADPGEQTMRLTEHVDLYPTLVELCGLPMPEGLEGTSLVPLLSDPERPWKRAVFSQVRRAGGVMGRMARTERRQYHRWEGTGEEELYDMEDDPHQLRNLAGDPEAASVMEEMRKVMDAGWQVARPGTDS